MPPPILAAARINPKMAPPILILELAQSTLDEFGALDIVATFRGMGSTDMALFN